ncbi:pVI [White sturgeon adenovirus 1]|uniref:PVI n=1 Tax=White sturgeon adenovirus 1 TaxID=2580388 RepID=A0A4P8PIX1_9ADEN|nr:pVI [White sturgeon adenovirus 1]QCQ84157.1 pVI [White sturgeon adenovirus 1]
MFSHLAPSLGGQPLCSSYNPRGDDLLHGDGLWDSFKTGFSNFGTNAGNFLSKVGHSAYSGAKKFANSSVGQTIKDGIKKSGVIENLVGTAGTTLNSLADIARMKAEMDMQRLAQQSMGITPEDILRAQAAQNQPMRPQTKPAQPPRRKKKVVRKKKYYPTASITPAPIASTLPAPLPETGGPLQKQKEDVMSHPVPQNLPPPIIPKKRRLSHVAGYGRGMLPFCGRGVSYSKLRKCY